MTSLLIEIYFTKSDFFFRTEDILFGDLKDKYVKVYENSNAESFIGCVYSDPLVFLDMVFARFVSMLNPLLKDENWKTVKELVTHQAMETGDVVRVGEDYWVVARLGFRKLIAK